MGDGVLAGEPACGGFHERQHLLPVGGFPGVAGRIIADEPYYPFHYQSSSNISFLFSFLPDTSIVLTVVYFAYRIIGESSICNGATIGKKAMGLKVVDSNFETIGLSQSAGRTFSKILSWALICIGFIMILFSKRRQALHDRLTGTYVIKVRA